MKTKTIFIAGSLALLTLASCKKDYTCECTTTTGGVSTSASTVIKDKKSKAEEACNAGDASVSNFGIAVTTECEIL